MCFICLRRLEYERVTASVDVERVERCKVGLVRPVELVFVELSQFGGGSADDGQCFGLLLLGFGRRFYGHPAIGYQNFVTVLLLSLPQVSFRSTAGMG
jgi:hypothetical protein